MQLKGAIAVLVTAFTIGGAGVRAEQRPRLESTIAADTASKWNCGMPVVQPPADVDPKFERKPDDRISMAIRRAAPRACGR
jgi:hypothetical protein